MTGQQRDPSSPRPDPLDGGATAAIRQVLRSDPTIPTAPYIDDHVRNAVIMLATARAERDAALARVKELEAQADPLEMTADDALRRLGDMGFTFVPIGGKE